jgi:cation transport ATPase
VIKAFKAKILPEERQAFMSELQTKGKVDAMVRGMANSI